MGQRGVPPARPKKRGKQAGRIGAPDRSCVLGQGEDAQAVRLTPAHDPLRRGLLEQDLEPARPFEVGLDDVAQTRRDIRTTRAFKASVHRFLVQRSPIGEFPVSPWGWRLGCIQVRRGWRLASVRHGPAEVELESLTEAIEEVLRRRHEHQHARVDQESPRGLGGPHVDREHVADPRRLAGAARDAAAISVVQTAEQVRECHRLYGRPFAPSEEPDKSARHRHPSVVVGDEGRHVGGHQGEQQVGWESGRAQNVQRQAGALEAPEGGPGAADIRRCRQGRQLMRSDEAGPIAPTGAFGAGGLDRGQGGANVQQLQFVAMVTLPEGQKGQRRDEHEPPDGLACGHAPGRGERGLGCHEPVSAGHGTAAGKPGAGDRC